MHTVLNNNIFFQEDLIATRSHERKTFTYTEATEKIFEGNNIYTTARNQGKQRLQLNTQIVFGNFSKIEPYTMFLKGRHFHTMGAFSSSNSELPVNTIVGRYSSIAHNVKRMWGGHPIHRFTTSMLTYDPQVTAFNDYQNDYQTNFIQEKNPSLNGYPIIIGNDVWIGQDVTFSNSGITVGDGAVVAAGSIVTKDVPPYAIVAGAPAKIKKFRFPPLIIEKVLALRWWQYDFGQFKTIKASDDIEVFIEKMAILTHEEKLKSFSPRIITIDSFKD